MAPGLLRSTPHPAIRLFNTQGGWPILNFAFFAKFRVGMFTISTEGAPALVMPARSQAGHPPEKEISCSSIRCDDIEFYFDFVSDLNGSARDAYWSYSEGALLERCGTAIVAIL
jgi:hypothetical protein